MTNKNQIEPKMKFFSDTLDPLPMYNIAEKYQEINLNNSTRVTNNMTTRRDNEDLSGLLLDRQFASVLKGSDLESRLQRPTNCNITNKLHELEDIRTMNEISESGNKNLNKNKSSDNNNMLDSSFDLLINQNAYIELSNKYNVCCSERRKNLNWGDYRAPPQQTTGRGFGNPDNYEKTYIGIDSRMDGSYENPRSTDLKDRGVIPQDGFRINYGNVPYDSDPRSGSSTRTYKKTQTNF